MITYHIHDELRCTLGFQVLQTFKQVVVKVVKRVSGEAAEREHARLSVVKHEELHDRRAAW